MKVLLNCHSGPLTVDERALKFVRWLGVDGVRRVVPVGANLEKLARQANRNRDLTFLFYLPRTHHIEVPIKRLLDSLEVEAEFEFGIEATLGRDPIQYGLEVQSILYDLPVKPIVTATHRFRKEESVWMDKFLPVARPPVLGVHTYRTSSVKPDKGWKSLREMFSFIWSLGKWANTETGWHTSKTKCWRRKLSERKVAEYLFHEISLHREWWAEFFTIYQAFNGPEEKDFGLLKEDTFEPLERAHILRGLLKERNV